MPNFYRKSLAEFCNNSNWIIGSYASKSTSAYSVNYSTVLRNGNAFKLGDLDVSKSKLLLNSRRIILMDEILDVKVFPHPLLAIESFHLIFLSKGLW